MRVLKKKKLLYSILITAILFIVVFLAWPAKKIYQVNSVKTTKVSTVAASPNFNKNEYPIDNASSLWAVVNKGRALPSSYTPSNLVAPTVPLRLSASDPEMHVRADTATALEKMFAVAKSDGLQLMLASGYRSYAEQVTVYGGFVKSDSQASADTYSARPGHSEHQTGLAADLEPASQKCEINVCFADTPEGKWLAANSYKYGFIIRYQKNTQNLTGYEYEPWHVRYLGDSLAQKIYQSAQTLEQFFGLPVYASYPTQIFSLSDQ